MLIPRICVTLLLLFVVVFIACVILVNLSDREESEFEKNLKRLAIDCAIACLALGVADIIFLALYVIWF